MLRNIWRLLYWWGTSDRIRISPREGRLLRLSPGSHVLISGEPARILERRTDHGCIRYLCDTAAGECELVVGTNGVIVLFTKDGQRSLNDEQVEAIVNPECSKPFNF